MDIAIVNDAGEPELYLRASDFLNYWFWDSGRFSQFSAYMDLVFRAKDDRTLTTKTRCLSERWKVKQGTVLRWLKSFKKEGLIDYEKTDFARMIRITILIPEQEDSISG